MAELVHRHHVLDLVTTIDQEPRIAGEGRGVAGHGDHHRHLARGELQGLRLRALTRGIEHHGVEVAQLLRHQRAAEQVARLAPDRLQAGRARGFRECGDRAGVVVKGGDARLLSEPQRKRADAAEEVEHLLGFADALGYERGQRLFARDGGLQEGARRQRHLSAAHLHDRCQSLQHQLAMYSAPPAATITFLLLSSGSPMRMPPGGGRRLP